MKKVWFRAQTGWWYLSVKEKGVWRQLRLVKAPHTREGRQQANKLAVTELAARQFQEDVPHALTWITVAHVLDGFLRHSKEEHHPVTYEWYKGFFDTFKPKYGGLRINLLKNAHVRQWVKDRGFSPTTQNRAIGALKRAFQWAVEEEHIPRSPIGHMRKPQPVLRDRILTADERALILSAIPDAAFRDYVTALGITGARPGEVARVTAEDVDLTGGLWLLRKHKTAKRTGRPRIIYLCPEALELTKRKMQVNPEGTLFRNTRGKPWTKNAVRLRFSKLRKRFPQLKGVVAYTFRSSFATDALEAGVPDATVAALLGQTNTNTLHRFYARLSHKVAHLKNAVAQATQPGAGDAPRGRSA